MGNNRWWLFYEVQFTNLKEKLPTRIKIGMRSKKSKAQLNPLFKSWRGFTDHDIKEVIHREKWKRVWTRFPLTFPLRDYETVETIIYDDRLLFPLVQITSSKIHSKLGHVT